MIVFLLRTWCTNSLFWYIYYTPLHVSSTIMLIFRRSNCISTSSGIVTLFRWLFSTQVTRGHCPPENEHNSARNMWRSIINDVVWTDELRDCGIHILHFIPVSPYLMITDRQDTVSETSDMNSTLTWLIAQGTPLHCRSVHWTLTSGKKWNW